MPSIITRTLLEADRQRQALVSKARAASRRLVEAYDITRAAPGKVPFKSSQLTDPHIRDIVNAASAKTGVSAALIDAEMQDKIDKIEEMKKYSYLLYDTAAKNAASNAAFDLIEHSREENLPKFDPAIFHKLVEMIQLENEQFFPLRQPGDVDYVFDVNPILVPSNKAQFQKYNQIGTAAATAKGDFIFNVPFMQKLMDWATVEGLKPKGLKYESNGGPIPDCYAYIEFLILHELLHYSYGDFNHGRRLPQYTPTEHNYASDFRSNYMLVKNGFEQLPIGLFSDHINADRQETYKDMVDLVHNELKKLPKPLQQTFKDIADMDDHSEGGDEGGGDEEGSKDGGGGGEPGEKSGDKPDGDSPGAGKEPSQEDINKDIEEKLSRRKEIGSDKEAEEKAQEKKGKTSAGGPGGSGVSDKPGEFGGFEDRAKEIAAIKPRFNWKSLIKMMISSSVQQTDITYSKPSRRNVTGAVIAKALGAAAVKPGEKTLEQQQVKIMLVIDTSGSMWGHIPRVLREAQAMLTQMGQINAPIGLAFFTDSQKYFVVNMGKNNYAPVTSMEEIIQNKPKGQIETGWKNVLTKASSGGTLFTDQLKADLSTMANAGYNIMLLADYDGAHGKNFLDLWRQHKDKVFYVATGERDFQLVCGLLGQVPKTFGHM